MADGRLGGDETAGLGVAHSRRELLRAAAAMAGAALLDPGAVLAGAIGQTSETCAEDGLGELLAVLPVSRRGLVTPPFGVKIGGAGLDARLVTDLSRLEPDRLVTPTERVYVRTECPAAVSAQAGPWQIRTSGLMARAGALSFEDLARRARPMGAHLVECSGNSDPTNFGLMSVAEWTGVPLVDVVAQLQPSAGATAVLVSGVDPDGPSTTSVAGASWIFPLEALDRTGAFLAVEMNGGPLAPDHGRPVRLAVPGWYGCAWIKWVNEIRLVGALEPATAQMKEFAGRTHQTGVHELASEYAPATIETAATPVRVEKRRSASGFEYRVVGIVWGGVRPVSRLAIRFGGDASWRPFDLCPAPRTTAVWSLWAYRWKPAQPGVYDIALRVPDPSVPQRRLDMGYYVRQVRIDDV